VVVVVVVVVVVEEGFGMCVYVYVYMCVYVGGMVVGEVNQRTRWPGGGKRCGLRGHVVVDQ
jgi:hypothetical protein